MTSNRTALLLAAGAGAAYLVYRSSNTLSSAVDGAGGWARVPGLVGQAAGGAVVDAADGLFSGTIIRLGQVAGLAEPTDYQRGSAALDAGNYLEASVYLPAGDFLSGLWNKATN